MIGNVTSEGRDGGAAGEGGGLLSVIPPFPFLSNLCREECNPWLQWAEKKPVSLQQ